MSLENIYRKSPQFVDREIAGQVILMPLCKASKDVNYIYTLNRTAASAWRKLNGKKTLAAVKKELLREFRVNEKTLDKELAEFIKDLKSIKAIKK